MASGRPSRPRPHAVLTPEVARQWCDYEPEGAAKEPVPMASYTHITPAAARILGKDRSERELYLDGLTTLSAEAAKGLAKYRGPLSLNGLRKIDPELEKILAWRTRKGTYCQVTLLQGLDVLESSRLAKVFAAAGEYHGALYLKGLRRLSLEAAAILAKKEFDLFIGGRVRLDPELNRVLLRVRGGLRFFGRERITLKDVKGLGADGERYEGRLNFVDARQLDADAAAELAHYPGAEICFSSLENISPEAAEALAPYPGELRLQSVLQHAPEVAVILAKRSGRTHTSYSHMTEASDGSLIVRLNDDSVFNLGLVRTLTPELAATLAEAPILDLRNLKKLTPQAALVLAKQHHGTLLLDGLESLPNKVAAALSWHDGGVSLRKVQRLSPTAAAHLVSVRGFLSLGGLKTLSSQLAAVLADCPGNLMLDGVTQLTPGVARKLQKHTGILSMNGVREISEETAKILAKKPNQKRMVRCGGSVAALQYLLKNDGERVTMMFRLNADGAFE
jgi:hypothetical protein